MKWMAPRCVAPKVRPCRTCSGTSSASGGSKPIAVQRTTAARGAEPDQLHGGPMRRHHGARRRRTAPTSADDRDRPQRAAPARRQALRAPVQRAEGVEHGVRGLHRAAGHQEDRNVRERSSASAPGSSSRGGLVAAFSRPEPDRPRQAVRGRGRQRPAADDQPDGGARRPAAPPPSRRTKLAAMKLSDPHSRMRP